jgi:hypothetical protein
MNINKRSVEIKVAQSLDRLNPRELDWVREYLRTGSPKKAMLAIDPDANKVNTTYDASHKGSKMLQRKDVKNAINAIMKAKQMDILGIAEALYQEIWEKPARTPSERQVRMSAIREVIKIQGLDRQKEELTKEELPIKIVMSEQINSNFKEAKEEISEQERDNSQTATAPAEGSPVNEEIHSGS